MGKNNLTDEVPQMLIFIKASLTTPYIINSSSLMYRAVSIVTLIATIGKRIKEWITLVDEKCMCTTVMTVSKTKAEKKMSPFTNGEFFLEGVDSDLLCLGLKILLKWCLLSVFD